MMVSRPTRWWRNLEQCEPDTDCLCRSPAVPHGHRRSPGYAGAQSSTPVLFEIVGCTLSGNKAQGGNGCGASASGGNGYGGALCEWTRRHRNLTQLHDHWKPSDPWLRSVCHPAVLCTTWRGWWRSHREPGPTDRGILHHRFEFGDQYGGGVVSRTTGGTVRIANTIVAQNTAPIQLMTSRDRSPPMDSISSAPATTATDSPQQATRPEPLAAPSTHCLDHCRNNGGPTETMALLPGSPAIDKGNARHRNDRSTRFTATR